MNIQQPIHARMAFTGGQERDTPIVEVTWSNYQGADDKETMLQIEDSASKNKICLSLDTLIAIANWAKGKY